MREPTDIVPIILPGLFRRTNEAATPPGTAGRQAQGCGEMPVTHRPPRLGWRALDAVFAPSRVRTHWG
jgi:hypothetical protein